MNKNQAVEVSIGSDGFGAITKPLEVQRFTFEFSDAIVAVRGGVREDGIKVFVAKDITDALEYSEFHPNMIGHVREQWKGRNPITTIRGVQEVWMLTAEGVNHFCMRSDKPRAQPFQEWIAGDVLPQIDRTGRYEQPKALPAPANPLDVLQGMVDALRSQDARIAAQAAELRDVRSDVVELRASFEEQMAAVVRAPVADKPAGCESLSKLKAAWNEKIGLPDWVTEQIVCQLKQYRLVPRAYVGRGVRHHTNGELIARPDGTPVMAEPYFVYQSGVVTRTIERFLTQCERHATDKRKATHPALPGQPFNLHAGFAKGEK
jgi:prophage antirepressor-like protein